LSAWPQDRPKFRVFEQFARVAKALGHPHRLELLELLAQGERSVDALAGAAGLTVANTSRHLQQLRQSGLVTARKEGLYVFYRLSADDVVELLRGLRRCGERHLDTLNDVVAGYFHRRDSLEPVTREDLVERCRQGGVTLLDVRPAEEYAAGHLPGACNVTLKDLPRHLDAFPRDQEVIAYCRGEYCVLAYEAVALLNRSGFTARRLEEGFPEWRAAGLPVERETR
jgi:rhodanese-related sulfurtransferase/DNA-binding transcriptional ArsR family regulator